MLMLIKKYKFVYNKKMPLKKIKINTRTIPNRKNVENMEKRLKEGKSLGELEPMVVVYDGKETLLEDGIHTYTVLKEMGREIGPAYFGMNENIAKKRGN